MKNIFILEDSPERIKKFYKELVEICNITICNNVSDAIRILNNQYPVHSNYDIIFLDHDLGGQCYVDSNESNTGYQVAKFLKEKNYSGWVIIHSLNPDGRRNMKSILPDADEVPFWNIDWDKLKESLR